jgi:ActR/RegA family two-component response regulator
MKPRLVLLYTHDRNFDRLLSEALIGTGAIVLIARSVGDALQVVSSRWRELDFAILDFNDGCRAWRCSAPCIPVARTYLLSSEDHR